MQPIHYFDLDEFKDIYLEDSFVLDINTTDTSAVFIIEVVLKKEHALYRHPLPDEQYCYRKASLCFLEAMEVTWIRKTMCLYQGINREKDYGNIDSLLIQDAFYYLSGDWGEMRIKGSKASLFMH